MDTNLCVIQSRSELGSKVIFLWKITHLLSAEILSE